MTVKAIAVAGAVLAGLGVGLGAFGAHGLDRFLEAQGFGANLAQRAAWFDTAVRYQLYHALGLLAVAALAQRASGGAWGAAAAAILVGVALFSGSLYAMTFLGDEWRKLGMVTPLGGLALIAGWAIAAIAAWRNL